MDASKDGRLMEVLEKLPRARWAEPGWNGNTFLHYACMGPNVAAVVALLQLGEVDMNASNDAGMVAAHYAAAYGQVRIMQALCAVGADVEARHYRSYTPLDLALAYKDGSECARVLVANGVRVASAARETAHLVTPELKAIDAGLPRCRAATIAVLRVKRPGKLARWDRFLLVLLARHVWATRVSPHWSRPIEEPRARRCLLQ